MRTYVRTLIQKTMIKIAKTIKIDTFHEDWLKSNHINFSDWVRNKLDEEIDQKNKSTIPNKLKAIILAAGKDPSLFPLTAEIPKTMLDVKGKTILLRQIEMLRMVGIQDIAIVRGYKKHQINYPNTIYFDNDNYEITGSLDSLLLAREFMDCDCIILYGDILFSIDILKKLVNENMTNVMVVDRGWKKHYQESQEEHPYKPELIAAFDKGQSTEVHNVGLDLPETDLTSEFIGLAKLSIRACSMLREFYDNVYIKNPNKRFHQSKRIREASIIDFFQELIDQGEKVTALEIWRDWIDVDNFEDYHRFSRH